MRWRFPICAVWVLALAVSGCAHTATPGSNALREGMIRIPAGPFVMGQGPEDGIVGIEVGVDSLPRHEVQVAEFWIDRTEVSMAEYGAFISETDHRPLSPRAYVAIAPSPRHPAIGLSYYDAEAYCQWAGKRLPTEAEWEKAARGTDGRLYPWGNEWDPERVVYEDTRALAPDPVGSRPANVSPYGVLDMAGNVLEWTTSWYEAYPGNNLERRSFGKTYKVLKGGSWETEAAYIRSASRFAILPVIEAPSYGARCVVSWHR